MNLLEGAPLALAMNAGHSVVFVPGTYEAPLILENMLMDDSLDAACVLGYIEKVPFTARDEISAR